MKEKWFVKQFQHHEVAEHIPLALECTGSDPPGWEKQAEQEVQTKKGF